MIIGIIIAYIIIALVATLIEHKAIKRDCNLMQSPKLDYCFIRGFFFPLVIIKKVYDYVIK